MNVQQWFDGIYLIGQFNWFRTGCWLLAHQGEGAILEMPPVGKSEQNPAIAAQQAVKQLGLRSIKYLCCTHAHYDHFSLTTFAQLRASFPQAEAYFHRSFRRKAGNGAGINYFDEMVTLRLAGEPLFLVHAPKHSHTDTLVIFRGAICTGDWELGTIRSVHDWVRFGLVSTAERLRSIERMEHFPADYQYHIHQVFSVHANDKREGVDFPGLMASTKEDRQLW